jgi:FtsH-binding integral membrane protein
MTKVYGWMSLALGVTGLVAFWTASNPTLINFIFGSQIVFFILIIAQLLIVGGLVGFINKISAQMATLIFIFLG